MANSDKEIFILEGSIKCILELIEAVDNGYLEVKDIMLSDAYIITKAYLNRNIDETKKTLWMDWAQEEIDLLNKLKLEGQ